ncbi:hypothetical protein Tco_0371817 [Tanacetum coccineum]
MEEINNFQQEPNETLYQAWERFKELLMKCPQHYLMEMQEKSSKKWLNTLKNGIMKHLGQEVLKLLTDWLPYEHNLIILEEKSRRQSMEETLSKFMSESAKRHEENSNMIKEIRASTDVTVRNQGASIKTLEIQIGQERGFGSLPSSTEANPRDHVKSILTTTEADSNPIRRIGSP